MTVPVEHYLGLLRDRPRLDGYARAIRRVVRDGHVVADLGSGLGTFAVLAALAGARRVYAVEAEPAGRFVRELAAANGVGDRVQLLEGCSTELAVPERADVCLFDDVRLLDLAGCAATLADAGARWLAPGGAIVPAWIELWIAPVAPAASLEPLEPLEPPAGRPPLDLAPFQRLARHTPWTVRVTDGRALIGRPRRLLRVDAARLADAEHELAATVTATRTGRVGGLLCWCRLGLARGVALDTGPGGAPTAYPHALFPLASTVPVRRGQAIRCTLRWAAPRARAGTHRLWSWTVSAAGASAGGSSFAALPLPQLEGIRTSVGGEQRGGG
jgi:hypothetical protein